MIEIKTHIFLMVERIELVCNWIETITIINNYVRRPVDDSIKKLDFGFRLYSFSSFVYQKKANQTIYLMGSTGFGHCKVLLLIAENPLRYSIIRMP